MAMPHVSMRWQDYLAVGRFPTIHKRPQQHVVKIVEKIERAMKKWKIEGYAMNSRTMKRDE